MTTVEYRYNQPGQDDLRVEAMGFAHGFDAPIMLFFEAYKKIPATMPSPDGFVTNLPRKLDDVKAFACEAAEELVRGISADENEEMVLTTAPDLFKQHYAKSFAEGYRFGMFALARESMLLYELYKDTLYSYAFTFAWQLKLKEPAIDMPKDEHEQHLLIGVEAIQEIYEDYRRLN